MPRTRQYEETHPWLKFPPDLRNAPWRLWAMLGECQSKCEHLADVPLMPRTRDELHQLYFAKGALASAAIEGNTLTQEQLDLHLQGKLNLGPSRAYQIREVENILNMCDNIVESFSNGKSPTLSLKYIKQLNAEVLDGTKYDEGVVPGEIPRDVIGVGRYRGAPREDCEYLLDRICEWVESSALAEQTEELPMSFAILRAAIAHLYFEWVHPFGDGNGRTGRLLEFHILISSGVPAPAAQLLSNHYNRTRAEYYRQLEYSSKSGGDIVPYVTYAVEGFRDGLREQLDFIRRQRWILAWRSYIYEHPKFRNQRSAPSNRRRRLVLDLSECAAPVPLGSMTEISPRVAREYATVQKKTLQRDLEYLEDLDLIIKTDEGYRTCMETILAFRPFRVSKA